MSRYQLVRAFDATVGMSPTAYLRRMRVERIAACSPRPRLAAHSHQTRANSALSGSLGQVVPSGS